MGGGSIDELLELAEDDIKGTEGVGRMFSEIGKAAEIGVLVKELVEIAKDKSPEMVDYKHSVKKSIEFLRNVAKDYKSSDSNAKEMATRELNTWLTQVRDIIQKYKVHKKMI